MSGGVERGEEPLDRRIDRRRFLERMGALTAMAASGAAGGALAPAELAAAGAGATGRTSAGGAAPAARRPSEDALRREGASVRDALDHAAASLDRTALQDPAELTLAQAAAAIRDGALDPRALVEACLARVERLDVRLRAWNAVVADAARARAEGLARAPWRGPLHGIPLGLKDNYYTAGVPTTANSRIFADFVPTWDATAWARLESAGGVLLGKTQMGPLATTAATTPEGVSTTRNAWAPDDPDVSPGGSSSGSATAVAARMVPGATGTQTGGSITSPSLAQGLTGLKPTLGRVSLHGVIPLTYTRDHPGPIARDAVDAALLLQAMAGPDDRDPRTLGLPQLPDLVRAATAVREGGGTRLRWPTTVGVPPGFLDDPDDEEDAAERREEDAEDRARRIRREELQGARRELLAGLERVGARVVELPWPERWDELTSGAVNDVRLPERTEPFLPWLREDVRLFGVSLSPWIHGLLLPGAEYLRGQRAKMALLTTVLDELFAECDVVLQTSPVPFDMIGLPLVAFPIGMAGGRPTGAMLGGLPYAEDRLLSVVAAWQDATDWHTRRPPDPDVRSGSRGSGRQGRRLTLEDVVRTAE